MSVFSHIHENIGVHRGIERERQREREREILDLEQSGGIGNVVPHPPLRGNANLIFVNLRLRPWLLHPLIPIHTLQTTKIHRYVHDFSKQNPDLKQRKRK
jgi:hypothetical protein